MKSMIPLNIIKDILRQNYKIDVLQSSSIKRGLINQSFYIESVNKRYVFRVYSKRRNKTKKDILYEIKIMSIFKEKGFPVPKIFLNINKQYITKISNGGEECNSILMEFIEGSHLKRNNLAMVKKLGELQAGFHLLSETKIKPKYKIADVLKLWDKWSREEISKIKPVLKEYRLEKIYLDRFNKTKRDLNVQFSKLLQAPYGECHGDFFGGNILIKKGKIVGVIDFDNITTSPFVFDIANTLKSWLFSSKKITYGIIYNNYLIGYEKYRKLSEEELELLPTLVATRNFAVTNSLCTRNIIKSKKRIEQALKFDDYWQKFIASQNKIKHVSTYKSAIAKI